MKKQSKSIDNQPGIWPEAVIEPDMHYELIAEQIIHDELDLRAGDTGNEISDDSSARLFCTPNTGYEFVSGQKECLSGKINRFHSEIRLGADRGSIVYLISDLSYAKLKAITFRYCKSNHGGRCYFRLIKYSGEFATVSEGSLDTFPFQDDTDWHLATIPIDLLEFETVEGGLPAPDSNRRHDTLLEVGMDNAVSGDNLLLDRVSLLHRCPPAHRLEGTVEPAMPGLPVNILTGEEIMTAMTDVNGNFKIDPVSGTGILEIFVNHQGSRYYPLSGRFHEVGTYLPDMRIFLDPAGLTGTLPNSLISNTIGSEINIAFKNKANPDNSIPDSSFEQQTVPELTCFDDNRARTNGILTLNPVFSWSAIAGAREYEVTVIDETAKLNLFPPKLNLKQNIFQIPLESTLFPGHTYALQIRAGDGQNWGQWSKKHRVRVAGVTPAVIQTKNNAERDTRFDLRSGRRGGAVARKVMAIAEALEDPMEIRLAVRPYFTEGNRVYREFIRRVQDLGYIFKQTHLYSPEDAGKPYVYYRFDIHLNDVAPAYGIMDANLDMQIPADYHLTWELSPLERAYAKDFFNLRKLGVDTQFVHFGFHTNPLHSWLVAEKFNCDVPAYREWSTSDECVEDFLALAYTGECSLGTYEEFLEGAEEYFYYVSKRFKKYFPESLTLSHHGQIPSLTTALKSVDRGNREASKRINALNVRNFTCREEMYKNAGYVINHTAPHQRKDKKVAWVYCPFRDFRILPDKWAEIEKAKKEGNTLFMYSHPCNMQRIW